ncbi:MAG: RNA polymerase sigma factor [Planctomycetota bacterium]|nr:RNA polymerase sigma factor [Planctomycetota bacterium]
MPDRDDTALLLAAGKGDRQAFGALIERHHRAIIQFAHRFLSTGDRATAEDIAQQVFLAAWKAAPSFRPRAAVRTWLFRIATNTCLNHQRSRRRKPVSPLVGEPEAGASAGRADPPDAAALEHERAEALQRAIDGLPANQRAAILLRHVHDLSYAEIASVLETSISAVESLLFRARSRLREVLEPGKDDQAPQDSPACGAES